MQPDRDLDRELRDLGPRVEYPPVPDLAGSVRDRLETEVGDTGSPPRARPQVWWIAVAALLLLVAVPVVALVLRDFGGGAFSAGGGAAGSVAESGGRETGDGGPTRLTEDAAPGPTHSAGDDGSLAADAGGGTSSLGAAESGASASAGAACAFPASLLQIRPNKGAPGTQFVLQGENFVDAAARTSSCDDTPPFNRQSDAGSRLAPPRDVRLDFRQGERTWKLGVVRPGRSLGFRVQMRVPENARPGAATITATGESVLDPSEVSFRVSPK